MTPTVTFAEGPPRRYEVDGERTPSVTEILGCLNKPALPWWGMTVGVQAVCELIQNRQALDWSNPDEIVSLVSANKLSVNHVRDIAATRGQSVHRALELYATEGTVPDPSEFPAEDRGYVRALAKWLWKARPEFLDTEVVVGSAEHSYAGRYDVLARVDGRLGRIDAKTSKRVYDPMMLQLEAYEQAAVECDGPPSDFRAVLRLDKDGSYEVVESWADFDQFLGVKAAFDALQRLKAAKPKRPRRKVAA